MESTATSDIQEKRLSLVVGVMRDDDDRWLPLRRHLASDLRQKGISGASCCSLYPSNSALKCSRRAEQEPRLAG
jgi:hypothetical protein